MYLRPHDFLSPSQTAPKPPPSLACMIGIASNFFSSLPPSPLDSLFLYSSQQSSIHLMTSHHHALPAVIPLMERRVVWLACSSQNAMLKFNPPPQSGSVTAARLDVSYAHLSSHTLLCIALGLRSPHQQAGPH